MGSKGVANRVLRHSTPPIWLDQSGGIFWAGTGRGRECLAKFSSDSVDI